jgi:branched-chain amino acid transport system permease protein
MDFQLAYFVDQLINGVTLGSIYGLIAIGYTMVYGIIGMINFAHGEIFMIGTFLVVIFFMLIIGTVTFFPLAVLVVLILAVLFTSIYGWTLERVAYRPLRGSPRLAALITAIGMSIFLQNYVQLLQGARNKPLTGILEGKDDILKVKYELINTLNAAGQPYLVTISNLQLLIIVLTVVVMVVFSQIISRTALGRAQRACEQDRGMAALLGINVDKTISATFVMGASLAAVASLMFMLHVSTTDFFVGFLIGVKAFTAAVLGGIGSLPGAMLGGMIIGLVETFFGGYFNQEYKDVATFTLLVLVLIFRPTGILGKPDIEKV